MSTNVWVETEWRLGVVRVPFKHNSKQKFMAERLLVSAMRKKPGAFVSIF